LRHEISVKASSIESLESRCYSLQNELESVRRSADLETTTIKSLHQKVNEYEHEIEDLSLQLEKSRSKLKDDVDAKENLITQLRGDLDVSTYPVI
jgi:chromosome segregation ATPase